MTDASHPDYDNLKQALEKILSITESVNTSIKNSDKIRAIHELVANIKGLAVTHHL